MLSAESAAIVRATASVVAEHSVQITSSFYPAMFEAHPELLRIFNTGNQANGDQRRALAASVVAYAVQLIDPDAPPFQPVMDRIAHKHVSLGIRPEQYTIVGHYLMGAVAEVLGDAVTPAVARAWDEVYWLFAVNLIAAESRLYTEQGVDVEHPWARYRVVDRIEDATDVVTLVLQPSDGSAVPEHRPGQYVSVAVDLPDGGRQPRQYTVSSGHRPGALQITVRRMRGVNGAPDGVVSTYLCEHAHPGAELDVSTPTGDVVLDDSERPLLLVSAGVGITPFAAMVDDLATSKPERPVVLAHADRSAAHHPLHSLTAKAGAKLQHFTDHVWYEESDGAADRPVRTGLMDLTDIPLPEDVQVYLCGPLVFMRHVRGQLLERGVPPTSIRYEVFGPDLWAGAPDAA